MDFPAPRAPVARAYQIVVYLSPERQNIETTKWRAIMSAMFDLTGRKVIVNGAVIPVDGGYLCNGSWKI